MDPELRAVFEFEEEGLNSKCDIQFILLYTYVCFMALLMYVACPGAIVIVALEKGILPAFVWGVPYAVMMYKAFKDGFAHAILTCVTLPWKCTF
jgi:hypothetical protein